MKYTVYEGDCLDILPSIADESVVCITDPPYGTTACAWDTVIPFEPMWTQLLRVSKLDRAIVLMSSQPFTSALIMSRPKMFKHEWVWIKNAGSNFANTAREPMKEHENILVFASGKWVYNKQMQERTGGGLSRVKTPVRFETGSDNYRKFDRIETKVMPELRVPSSWQKFNRERGLHPTQKPVDLMRYLIRTYTMPGETVMDFAMGSGTTGVAAVMEGRKFIGIESDPKHFRTADERLAVASLI